VKRAVYPGRRDGSALQRREEDASQGVADGDPVPALEWLRTSLGAMAVWAVEAERGELPREMTRRLSLPPPASGAESFSPAREVRAAAVRAKNAIATTRRRRRGPSTTVPAEVAITSVA
jgi:hypothetical protein